MLPPSRPLTGLADDEQFAKQMDPTQWGPLKERLTELFATKTRDEWCAVMEHTDVCFAPVLTMSEAAEHPHNVERETFVVIETLEFREGPREHRFLLGDGVHQRIDDDLVEQI